MKVLFIYNPYNNKELDIIERAKQEMGSYIEVKSIEEVSQAVKNYVRATPALIVVNDDLQGEGLLSEGVDGKLIATAMLYKRLEEEELAIHQAETFRLDNMIKIENTRAIDNYTLSLIEGGFL
jgi:hypothetical protein